MLGAVTYKFSQPASPEERLISMVRASGQNLTTASTGASGNSITATYPCSHYDASLKIVLFVPLPPRMFQTFRLIFA